MTMPKEDKERKKTAEELAQEVEELKQKLAEANKPPKATREEIEEAEPPISPTPPGGGMAQFMTGGTLKTAFVSFLVTILVVTGLGVFGGGNFVTKNDFTRNIQDVINAVDTVQKTITADQEKVNDAVAEIPSQVTNAVNQQIGDLKNTVQSSSSQVSDLSTRVDTLNNNISGFSSTLATLNEKINALEDQVADYEDRITELEDKKTTDGVVRSGDITADIDWDDDWQIDPTSSDNSNIICLFRLKVYNDSNEILDDLWLDFDLNGDIYKPNYSGGYGATVFEVDGRTKTSTYNFVFDDVRIRNMNLDPGEHERIYCELIMDFGNPTDINLWDFDPYEEWDIDFNPEVDIVDYEFD